MSDVEKAVAVPAATPVATVQAQTRVHRVDEVADRTFWIGHIVFSILALVGLAFIIWARGPRRRDALVSSSATEGKD